MIDSFVYLCAIPELYWERERETQQSGLRIAHLTAEALGVERRINKGINLEIERPRYTLLCQRLETEVIQAGWWKSFKNWQEFSSLITADKFPLVPIDRNYIDFIRFTVSESPLARLGTSFFPPNEVSSHGKTFWNICRQHGVQNVSALKIRAQFFQCAAQNRCGVIELQYPFAFIDSPKADIASQLEQVRNQLFEADNAREEILTTSLTLSKQDLHEVDTFQSDYKQRQVQTLSHTILQAIKNGSGANLSNRSNDVIAEVLHRFVYVQPSQSIMPAELRIIYADGSEGLPFPIRCRHQRTQSEVNWLSQHPPLKAVLMSMRHLDLDREVDLAWFRNREVSKSRALAETDEYCYQTTRKLLSDALKEGPLLLHMYHTGFEPAVVGFYRAVVEALQKHNRLGVLPYYYRDKKPFELGSWWL